MKLLVLFFSLLSTLVLSAHSNHSHGSSQFSEQLRKSTITLLESLTDAQQKSMLGSLDDTENRWQMQYTGGVRHGLQIKELNKDQREHLDHTLSLLLSKKGLKMAHKVADQDDGLGNYYVAVFGDPRTDKNFAFRLAEHHLTVVQVVIADHELKEFGPVLLGANPPNLWKVEEEQLLRLWKSIHNPSYLQLGQKAIASQPSKIPAAQSYSALPESAKAALRDTWQERVSIFTPAVRHHLQAIINDQGGWEKATLSFYNEEPLKRCIDGGAWDFKCNIGDFFWDFEGSRSHIHMSIVLK